MKKKEKLSLISPVSEIKGVGKKYAEIFEKRGIRTVYDLLEIFPVFYLDFSKPEGEISDVHAVYSARVLSITPGRNFRRRVSVLRVDLLILGHHIEAVFFNKPYLKNSLSRDEVIAVFGKIELKDARYSLVNPVFSQKQSAGIVPFYKNIGSIKQGVLRKIILNALENFSDNRRFLPDLILQKYGFPEMGAAFNDIHRPAVYHPDQIEQSRTRFKYYEFLLFHLELQFLRSLLLRKRREYRYQFPESLDDRIAERLNFTLTAGQQAAFSALKGALQEPAGMAALLQGDVGSGKTVIAFLAMLVAALNGYQSAVLVPTEVLAFQHLEKARTFFFDYRVAVLTGSTPAPERKRIIAALQSGEIDVIIGTHSLINEGVLFKRLSMIIIDEQHKFGVTQRASLFYKSRGVDLLVMTATPIPRTMLLAVYNDLKVFSIRDKPVNRKEIKTKIIPLSDRNQFYRWLRGRIEGGEKAYIILPLIEKSEFFSALRSIEEEKGFIKGCFKPMKVGIISGRVDKEERDRILEEFKSGALHVVLSTTVIEVGIDVEDASIIVIEDADRYGLAALHQLRGRVGRGERHSSCYLIPSKKITEKGKVRLKTIARESDGFKIAEEDLKIRGGGLIAGHLQSGDINFKNSNIIDDLNIFNQAKGDAALLLTKKELLTVHLKGCLTEFKNKSKLINFS